MNLPALITRLESATEGSRELDARIWAIIENPQVMTDTGGRKSDGVKYRPLAELVEIDWGNDWAGLALQAGAPNLSTSVDAALTTLPKHFSFELTASAVEDFAPGSFTRCRLWDWRRGPKMADLNNEWASDGNRQLPLNIVIAALRARQSSIEPL